MEPFEVMISESQERMLAIVEPARWDAVRAVCERWGLPVAVIGRVTDGRRRHGRRRRPARELARIPAAALTSDAIVHERGRRAAGPPPRRARPRARPSSRVGRPAGARAWTRAPSSQALLGSAEPREPARRSSSSTTRPSRRTRSPGPGHGAAVLRIKGTTKALVATTDANQAVGALDPWLGAALSVAEATRNVAITGARPLGVTNCLNYGDPTRPEAFWQLSEAVRGLGDACRALGPAGHRRQRLALQRVAGGRDRADARDRRRRPARRRRDRASARRWRATATAILLVGRGDARASRAASTRALAGVAAEDGPPALDLDRERRLQAFVREAVDARPARLGPGRVRRRPRRRARRVLRCGPIAIAASARSSGCRSPARRRSTCSARARRGSSCRPCRGTSRPLVLLARQHGLPDRATLGEVATRAATAAPGHRAPRRRRDGRRRGARQPGRRRPRSSGSTTCATPGSGGLPRALGWDDAERRPLMCGVFGVVPRRRARRPEAAAAVASLGLFALQHRGQESAGVAVSDGEQLMLYKDLGMIASVLDERRLPSLRATSRSPTAATRRPARRSGRTPSRRSGSGRGGRSRSATTATSSTPASCSASSTAAAAGSPASTDTELLTALLADEPAADTVEALVRVLPRVRGAFSLVVLDERRVIGVRDPHGFRPLVLGRLPAPDRRRRRRARACGATDDDARGWVLASRDDRRSTSSAPSTSATSSPARWSSSRPGRAPRSVRFAAAQRRPCACSSSIYFARPDSYMEGRNLYEVRRRMGEELAARAPGRRRPRDARARTPAPRPRPATPRRPASRTARAWSGTATPAGRSSSRARRCASAA